MYSEIHTTGISTRCVSAEIRETFKRYNELGGVPFETFFDALPADYKTHMAVVVLEPRGGFFYRHYGQAIIAVTGFDMTGKRTTDFDSDVGRFFSHIYEQAAAEQKPIFTLHRASHALNVHVWERLVLPFVSRGGEVVLAAVIIPREFKSEFLQSVLASSPDAIFAIRSTRDDDCHIVDAVIVAANDRFARSTGQSVEQIEGRRLREVMPGHWQNEIWPRYVKVIDSRQPDTFETEYRQDGLNGWFRVSAIPLGDGLNVCFTDITKLKTAIASAEAALREAEAAREELRCQSFTDHLTGILNRRGFDMELRSLQAGQSRYATLFAIITIDVDHFKQVNDKHGHVIGDAVLIGVSDVISNETCAGVDIIGRIGGEEFMVAMPHTTLPEAAILAERLRLRLARTAFYNGCEEFFVTASFGVKQAGRDQALREVLCEVDRALYQAKRAGRNGVVCADTEMETEAGRAAE